MSETAIFDKFGKSAYRLCGTVFYDYVGKPRGFLAGSTVYDLRGQHRGFYLQNILWDRMGRVLGFNQEARFNGLTLPPPDIPPVPYKNLPAPEPPPGITEVTPPALVPIWSMMRLENLLV